MRILIVEQERALAKKIQSFLQTNKYTADVVFDGITALEYIELGIFDLLIIEKDLSGLNGELLARRIREKRCGIPILMIAANVSAEERASGLNAGADYYMTRPCDPDEFLACVHALLRRLGTQVDERTFGDTSLNLSSGTLHCGENHVRLSAREFDIMRLLMQVPEQNLSKEHILAHVWGYDSNAVENHVEVYVGFLRKKLAAIGSGIRIVAIRRLGYHLELSTETISAAKKDA